MVLLVVAYAIGLRGVEQRSAAERDVGGDVITLGALAGARELVRAPLRQGQAVVFEVCADDGFGEAWGQSPGFEILYVEAERLDVVRRVPFDEVLAQSVRRDAEGIGCAVVADAESLGVAGEYVVAIAAGELPSTLASVRARGRVLAWAPLSGKDRLAVWLALAGALQLVVALSMVRSRRWVEMEPSAAEAGSETATREETQTETRRVVFAVFGLVGVMLSLAFAPLVGARGAVARGLVIALAEATLAFGLVRPEMDPVRPPRSVALGLRPPRRAPWLWLGLAPLLGLGLVLVGRAVVHAIPSTGVAPIEVFVEMPSGRLAVALIGVLAPVAEELFFRGFIFGALARWRGADVALGVTVVLFAVVHLPQQWGAWGAFLSVTMTGLVLTGLRRWTGSTLLCALVHLTHNGLITLLSI